MNKYFVDVRISKINQEIDENKKMLTDEIRNDLSHYSEEELITTTFIASGKCNLI